MRASILSGVIISEILDKGSLLGSDPNRFENQSNMYLQGERIAYQKYTDRPGADKEVVWVYKHPVIGSLWEMNKLTHNGVTLELSQELKYTDPLGSDLGYDPANVPSVQIDDPLLQLRFGEITDYSSGCVMDGVSTNCNIVQSALNNGWATQVPGGVSGLSWDKASQAYKSAEGYVVDWDNGFFGFVPQGATYGGNGGWKWNRPTGSLDDDEAPDGMLSPIPIRPAVVPLGYGRLVTNQDRKFEIYTCTGYVVDTKTGKAVPVDSAEKGITKDVTTADIVYSSQPTAIGLDKKVQPKFGLYGNDVRGHIVGTALGGQPVSGNLFSQNREVNNKAYKAFENGIRKVLTANQGWTAHLQITLEYPVSDCNTPNDKSYYYRPNGVTYNVTYSQGGKPVGTPQNGSFQNPRGF